MIPKQKQREVKKLMPNSSLNGANETANSITSMIGNEIDKVNTSIPGTIQSYNAGSNRAVVVPNGKRMFPDGRKLDYPAIYDVPVVFPTSMGGSCGVTFPIKSGDACLVLFSQENMQSFLGGQDVDDNKRFQLNDAIAIPGLYSNATQGADPSGVCLFFGSSRVTLDGNGFHGELSDGTMFKFGNGFHGQLSDGTNFNFSGGDLVVNGISLTKHTHGGVETGGANTAKPN